MRFAAELNGAPFPFGQTVGVDRHSGGRGSGGNVARDFARTVCDCECVCDDPFDEIESLMPAAFGRTEFRHFLLDHDFKAFVDGARFAGVADDDFIEEARFSEIGPPARRGLVLQFPDAVEVIAKSECGKTEPVVTPFRIVEQFAAERLRNDFRREEFRIEFFDFCVDGESGIGIPSKLECSAARHEVDADGDVRFEERFACGNRIRGSARLLVAAECSCGAFVPGKTALGAVAPELRLIAVGDVAHDVGGSAGGTVVENDVASEFSAVMFAERLFPFIFDALAVRSDDDEAFGFVLRDFRFRCVRAQEEGNGENACENQQDGDCFQIHCAGVPFWFL